MSSLQRSEFTEMALAGNITADLSSQWKELVDHFDSLQKSMLQRSEELKSKEKHLDFVQEGLESKEKHLDLVQKSIEERAKKVKMEEEGLVLRQRDMKERSEEVELKEKNLGLIRKCIELESKEVKSSEKNLELLKKTVQEHLKEVELEVKRLGSFRESIKEHLEKIELKEEECIALQRSVEEQSEEVDLRRRQLDSWSKQLEQKANILEWREKRLNYKDKSIEGCKEFELKKDKFDLILKTVQECLKELESQQKWLHPILRTNQQCLNELKVNAIDSSFTNLQFSVAMDGNSLQTCLNECLDEQELRHSKVPFATDELLHHSELVGRNKQASTLRQALGFTEMIPMCGIVQSQDNVEEPEYYQVDNAISSSPSENLPFSTTMDRSMILLLKEFRNDQDLFIEKVSPALQMSLDPARLVLDVLQEFYSPQTRKRDINCDANLNKNCTLLLDKLVRVPPEMKPHVKVKAMALAVEWKEAIRTEAENSFEVLVFLQFLAIYGLIYGFNGDEIFTLLKTVGQHDKAPELCWALGFADKIPDYIKLLVKKKEWLEAIRYIYAFQLEDQFSAAHLLEDHLECCKKVAREICNNGANSPDAQDEAADMEITALRDVIRCIKLYKLESELSPENLEEVILQLEKKKARRKRFAQAPLNKVELQHKNENKRPRTAEQGPT